MSLKTRIVAAGAGVALSLIAGGGLASAGPDVTAIVNSTCTYQQVVDALNAQSPAAAGQLLANPFAVGWLQNLVGAPPGSQQRRDLIQQAQAFDQVQQNTPLINSVAYSCSKF